MTSPLVGVGWERCALPLAPDPALDAEARRVIGMVPSWTGYIASPPWVVRSMLAFYAAVHRLEHIDPLLAGQVSLVVGQENSCRYCYAVQRLMLRLRGYSEKEVQDLEAKLTRAQPDARTEAALRFARRLSRSTPLVGADDVAALRQAGFSVDAIRELAMTASYDVFANRMVTIPAVPPDEIEQMPERWYFALARPVVRWILERHAARLPALPAADAAARRFVSFAPALGPFAGMVDGIFAGMWASTALPRRSKLLMIAVIGRALDCGRTVEECVAALAEEGLDATEATQALTHLRGDSLHAQEQRLLEFARETVWYQPTAIQRKTHALAQQLSREALVEVVGVTALANTLCRLRAALEPRG